MKKLDFTNIPHEGAKRKLVINAERSSALRQRETQYMNMHFQDRIR